MATRPFRGATILIWGIATLILSGCDTPSPSPTRPNIIIILADDLGFSDIGSYGGEIPTPHLDALARNGVRYTQFYNAGRCCPTRASLLTGLYQHEAGMGHMSGGLTRNDSVLPAYQGFLNQKCATIATLLRASGYETMHAGKWHVGNDKEYWPDKRGFDRHFSFINGAGSYFNLKPFWNPTQKIDLVLDNQPFDPPQKGYYLTNSITEHGLKFIRERNPANPFFLYLAYTAPHWPLHALEEDIDLFRGRYRAGWEAIRKARHHGLQQEGIIPGDQPISPPFSFNDTYTPDWDQLTEAEKNQWDTRMAVYAAMVYRMDQGIGKIVSQLKQDGQLENTLIMFLSDNGACHEPMYEWEMVYPRDGAIGTATSFDAYGYSWANVSNSPFRLFKSWTMEGGIRTPFIAHWPAMIRPGQINTHDTGHIIDLMPTCLDLAQTTYPATLQGRPLLPITGQSLLPSFTGASSLTERILFWEHEGNVAVREGPWKLVHTRRERDTLTRTWTLYNLDQDGSELHDLSAQYPEKVARLRSEYQTWAQKVGVATWDEITRWD